MSAHGQFHLLRERRFLPFFLTQALGAFNDNVFKNALLILIAFSGSTLFGLSSAILVNLATILFILPFLLFSSTFGQLADKYEKSRSIRIIKGVEIGIMCLTAIAFIFDQHLWLIALLFLMGLQSAAFGPIKHSILPQHLSREELTGGNGLVEMGTFLSILLGTLLGGVLIGLPNVGRISLAIAVIAVAVAGFLSSRQIPHTPPVAPELDINWNPISQGLRTFGYIRGDRAVTESILGIGWFWFLGSVFLAQIPSFTREVLGGTPGVTTLILTAFSLGIGFGSVLCERLSNRRVEPGIVPLGAFGISVFTVHLYLLAPAAPILTPITAPDFLLQPQNLLLLLDIVMIGASGGVFTVPLYAMVQSRTAPTHLSRVVSGNNILNALFMVLSGLYAIVLLSLDFSITELFLITALINVIVALYIFTRVPEFLVRLVIWLAIHFLYRVRVRNLSAIPKDGACVLIANHVSFLDALIIAGCCPRPVRFVMYWKIFHAPGVGWLFRKANAIPIAPASENPALLSQAFDAIDDALAKGQIVCVFPEGKLTHDGNIDRFRTGVERILARRPVPVVPMALRGLWNSWFSRRKGRALRGLPTYFRGAVEWVVGTPIAGELTNAAQLEQTVRELRGDMA